MLAIAGLIGIRWFSQKARELEAFLASCLYLNWNADQRRLRDLSFCTPFKRESDFRSHGPQCCSIRLRSKNRIGLVVLRNSFLVSGYFVFIYRRLSGKLKPEEGMH